MKKYLKERYNTYGYVFLGLLIGFIVVTLLFDKPDYKSAIIAMALGLIIGELFVFFKWSKNRTREKTYK